MSNRFGYRVEFDRFDCEYYVADWRGATVAGPFPTEDAGWAWVDEFTERRLDLRAGIGRFDPERGPLYETGAEWLARRTSERKGD